MITACLLAIYFLLAECQACVFQNALGISDGKIEDWQFIASSSLKNHEPSYARLNKQIGGGAWCSDGKDTKPWIKINLNGTFRITKIAMQGKKGSNGGQYVKSYKILYEKNGKLYHYGRQQLFRGPTYATDIRRSTISVTTSAIVIKPVEWHQIPCLRMEIYGCQDSENFCAKNNTCEHMCVNGVTEAVCKCKPGFRLANDRRHCSDIDECKEGKDRCDVKTTDCVNAPGYYKCECNHPGLEKRNPYFEKCFDKNECSYGKGGCNHICRNLYKTYKCSCYYGFKLSRNNRTCIDIDECSNGQNDCDLTTTTCTNEPGSYKCRCLSGLRHISSYNCTDIDECSVKNGGCEETCTNNYRSYKCSCPAGTLLHSDQHKCIDINECSQPSHGCQQICINQYASFSCDCHRGYQLEKDGKSCKDIDECSRNNGKGPCQHSCRNNIGSYDCLCPPGFTLSPDAHSCLDIDECQTRVDDCDIGTSKCINTQGSYECRCNPGYEKDPVTGLCSAKKCPALQSAVNGYIIPSDCMRRSQKHYKDVCTFKCNPGFEPNDKSVRTAYCNSDGNWDLRGGYQAICQRIRCGKVQEVINGSLVPSTCRTLGAEYGEKCNMYCDNGFHLTGTSRITCQQNGSYDGNFANTKCLLKKRLQCPKDVTLVLPLGSSKTTLPLSKLSVHIDASQYKTIPDGVLTGKHKFQAKHRSQQVQVISKSRFYDSCTFQVNVKDNEPPKVINCPTKDIYVTVLGTRGLVSWPEPKFKDNVGVEKLIQNIRNNDVLPQQVYFVYYAARDNYGNENVCRFFVHVKARYCSRDNIPGGEGGTKVFFPRGSNGLSAFITCLNGKTFSANVTSAPIFSCDKGIWQDVPDCVDFTPKNGTCPAGHITVLDLGSTTGKCAKCPKGTAGKNASEGTCQQCPVGYYQDEEGAVSCKECPDGTTSPMVGSKSLKQCQALCQPGGYSIYGVNPDTGCTACPDGSYQDLHGQRSCKLCPNGGDSFTGAKSENNCTLPARVSKIIPESAIVSKIVGDTINIKCYGTGNPAPFIQIKNATQLAPDSLRGISMLQPLVTGNKHISGLQLTITNAQTYDSAVYKCSADNIQGNKGNFDEREIIVEVSTK